MRILSILLVVCLKLIQADEKSSKCCKRVPFAKNIGFGLFGQAMQVDVGGCRVETCDGAISLSPAYVSVLKRIRNAREKTSQSIRCNGTFPGSESTCDASLSHVETIAFNGRTKSYDVINECACRKSPNRCERISKLKKYFIGTKYESTVDVGACAGGCKGRKGRKSCRETRVVPQVVKGPNGVVSVQTVRGCRCEASCYRQRFYVARTESEMRKDGSQKVKTKLVDVGRCVGSCPPLERCVAWSNGAAKCLMSLETTDVKCVPVRVRDVTYTDVQGREGHVTQVRRCGCT